MNMHPFSLYNFICSMFEGFIGQVPQNLCHNSLEIFFAKKKKPISNLWRGRWFDATGWLKIMDL